MPVGVATDTNSSGPKDMFPYNSRNLLRGALGLGWTLNTEQRISTPTTLPTYWSELGIPSEFPLPPFAAAREGLPLLPNTAQMSRARDGANMGFYLADTGNPFQLCPSLQQCTRPAVHARRERGRHLVAVTDSAIFAPSIGAVRSECLRASPCY